MDLHRRQFFGTLAGGAALIVSTGSKATPFSADWKPLSGDRIRAGDFGRERKFIETPSGRICYVDTGKGEPALFLHGYPLNSFQWRTVLERLNLDFRCVAPDFLGLGLTEPARDQDLRPLAQAKMLVEFMDALGIQNANFVASDSGGAVAQLLAAHHPQRVRSLILTNCDTAQQSPPEAMLPVIALSRKGQFVTQQLEPWYEDRDKARAFEGIGGMCYADPSHPTDDAIEAYFGPILATAQSRRLAELHAIAQSENSLSGIEAMLRSSTIPVRILWGADDTIFRRENADYLGSLFAGSRGVRVIRNARLFWPEEQPGVIAQEARALWR